MRGNYKFLVLCLGILLLNACSGDDANKPKNTTQQAESKKSSPKTTSLTYVDRKVWRAIIQWPDSCETDFDNRDGTWSGLTFWPIGPRQYLVEVQCFLAAYQPSNMYAWYGEETMPSPAKFLAFTVYSGEHGQKIVQEQVIELAGLSEFNAEHKELWITTKSRGLGDCGSFAKYEIQDGAAILKEFRA